MDLPDWNGKKKDEASGRWSIFSHREKMQFEAQKKFVGWLSSEPSPSPIFHISGKLGSGKSTLMKFLCSHEQTQAELRKWAGPRTLLFSSHFFWRNGTPKQKSMEGLYRSIIHDILKARPELIRDTFPKNWAKLQEAPWRAQGKSEISGVSICHALSRLLQNPRLHEESRVCIFIDGLDEFEPGLQDGLDYQDLVNTIRQWAVNAKGNLKLCVSSREEGVFMDEYANDPGFRLQNLTESDMQDYVRSRLDSLKDEKLKNKLIKDIPEKSSGIFLWTYLAVGTIRKKISYRATYHDLEQHLLSLPKGLEGLFLHVLQSLEPSDAVKTLRLIDLLQTARANGLQFPLLAFSFMDEYDRDPVFSMREDIEALRKDKELVLAQLRGTCGGLIEPPPSRNPKRASLDPDNLEFIHRSIPEMFNKTTGSIQLIEKLEAARGENNTVDVLSHILFASARLLRQRDQADRICRSVIIMRLRHKIDRPPYYSMDYMSSWVDDKTFDDPEQVWIMVIDLVDWCGMYMYVNLPAHRSRLSILYSSMCLAAHANNKDFLEWKIQNHSPDLENPVKRAILGQTILMSESWEVFFKYSIFTSDTHVPLYPSLVGGNYRDLQFADTLKLRLLSSWQCFIIPVILQRPTQKRSPFPWMEVRQRNQVNTDSVFPAISNSTALSPLRAYEPRIGNVVEMFLKQGADPRCQIRVAHVEWKVTITICFEEIQSHHEAPEFSAESLNQWVANECHKKRTGAPLDWNKDFEEEYSIREWLSNYNWPNWDTVADLMDAYDKNQMPAP